MIVIWLKSTKCGLQADDEVRVSTSIPSPLQREEWEWVEDAILSSSTTEAQNTEIIFVFVFFGGRFCVIAGLDIDVDGVGATLHSSLC